MLAKVLSSAVMGIDAYVVEVEVDISQGLPSFSTVGLPEGAVFTMEEAAGILKVPAEAVEQMVAEKQIKAVRIAGILRIPRRALFACLRGLTAEQFDDFLEKRTRT